MKLKKRELDKAWPQLQAMIIVILSSCNLNGGQSKTRFDIVLLVN